MTFLRTHRRAIVLAMFIGACTFASYLIVPILLGEAYLGIMPMYYDDSNIYRARIQEVIDGHPNVVSSYLHEYKKEPTNVAPVGEWLYALPAFVFGLSTVMWAYIFLLPAVLFFLVYLFTRTLIGGGSDRSELLTALAAGATTVFGFEFVDYHYLLSLFSGAVPAAFVWTRPVNPVLGALGLFGLLFLLWKLLEGKWPRAYMPGGILIAAMVGYYFAWGMALALLSVLFLSYAVQREYRKVRSLFFAGVISLLAISPYLYSAFMSFGGDEGKWAAQRTGMFFTHEPIINTVLLVTTVFVGLCFFYAYRKGYVGEARQSWIFLGAMLAAGWLAFNEQVITGRSIWYHHFVQYTVPFSYVAILSASYLSWRRVVQHLWNWAMGSLLFLMIAYGLYATFTVYRGSINTFHDQQKYAALIKWFNQNAAEECVVLPVERGEGIAKFIPAYTHCDVYLTASAFYAAPPERVLHNYLLQLRLGGLKPEDAEAYFNANEREVRLYRFEDWDQLFARRKDAWLHTEIAKLVTTYRIFVTEDLRTQIERYRVDYIVTDGPLEENIAAKLPNARFLETVGEFHVYAFQP